MSLLDRFWKDSEYPVHVFDSEKRDASIAQLRTNRLLYLCLLLLTVVSLPIEALIGVVFDADPSDTIMLTALLLVISLLNLHHSDGQIKLLLTLGHLQHEVPHLASTMPSGGEAG